MSSITIKELTDVVAETGGVTKVVAEQQITALFDLVSGRLKAGGEVTVRNFGRFSTKVKPARQARNPRTGDPVQVPERTVIKFTPRGDLK